jgi:hypothetical protein
MLDKLVFLSNKLQTKQRKNIMKNSDNKIKKKQILAY